MKTIQVRSGTVVSVVQVRDDVSVTYSDIHDMYNIDDSVAVETGWGFSIDDNGQPVFNRPADNIADRPVTVSPVEFMLLFTSPERIYIKSIRQSDPVVNDFMDIVEHPKLTIVNLSLTSTMQAVDYLLLKLVEAEVLTADHVTDRRASILLGTFQ